MKKIFPVFLPLFFCCLLHAQQKTVSVWLTDPAASVFFTKQITKGSFARTTTNNPVITLDETKKYQSIDGFGFALTGGSAMNMMKMSKAARAVLLKELFAVDKKNIGTSYLRLSIGASDLNAYVFSYDDMAAGETDTSLVHFNLGQDKKDVIPVLKEIIAINPAIKIMGSPWSPPVWMKTNHDTKGGSLLPEFYHAYAKYFVRYILAMQQEGIRIDAVTVQNEPLHPGNNPSLFMPANEQTVFVKDHLGPAFRKAHLTTKIIIYDHNADKPDYPISVLNDPQAKKYIDGSAFHLYGGEISALSKVHEAHPDKNIYFTEQWVGAPGNFSKDIREHIEKLIIGATRNWSKTVIEWNLAADAKQNPHTDRGGCTSCLGAVTISNDSITRNPAYYIIAHAAKFVRPGSVRIASTMAEGIPNVAFKTPDGKRILIVLNTSGLTKTFDIRWQARSLTQSISAGSVATYIW